MKNVININYIFVDSHVLRRCHCLLTNSEINVYRPGASKTTFKENAPPVGIETAFPYLWFTQSRVHTSITFIVIKNIVGLKKINSLLELLCVRFGCENPIAEIDSEMSQREMYISLIG